MSAHNVTSVEYGVSRVTPEKDSKSLRANVGAWRGERIQAVPHTDVLQEVLHAMKEEGYPKGDVHHVRLALEEAIVNAYEHGNRRDPAKRIKLRYEVTSQFVHAQVEDEGDGFDPGSVPDPTLPANVDKPHGRGLALMRTFMTQVQFNRRGNRITLLKVRTDAVEGAKQIASPEEKSRSR